MMLILTKATAGAAVGLDNAPTRSRSSYSLTIDGVLRETKSLF